MAFINAIICGRMYPLLRLQVCSRSTYKDVNDSIAAYLQVPRSELTLYWRGDKVCLQSNIAIHSKEQLFIECKQSLKIPESSKRHVVISVACKQVISTTLWREGPKLIQKELYQIHSQGVRDKIPSQKSVVNRVDWAKDVTDLSTPKKVQLGTSSHWIFPKKTAMQKKEAKLDGKEKTFQNKSPDYLISIQSKEKKGKTKKNKGRQWSPKKVVRTNRRKNRKSRDVKLSVKFKKPTQVKQVDIDVKHNVKDGTLKYPGLSCSALDHTVYGGGRPKGKCGHRQLPHEEIQKKFRDLQHHGDPSEGYYRPESFWGRLAVAIGWQNNERRRKQLHCTFRPDKKNKGKQTIIAMKGANGDSVGNQNDNINVVNIDDHSIDENNRNITEEKYDLIMNDNTDVITDQDAGDIVKENKNGIANGDSVGNQNDNINVVKIDDHIIDENNRNITEEKYDLIMNDNTDVITDQDAGDIVKENKNGIANGDSVGNQNDNINVVKIDDHIIDENNRNITEEKYDLIMNDNTDVITDQDAGDIVNENKNEITDKIKDDIRIENIKYIIDEKKSNIFDDNNDDIVNDNRDESDHERVAKKLKLTTKGIQRGQTWWNNVVEDYERDFPPSKLFFDDERTIRRLISAFLKHDFHKVEKKVKGGSIHDFRDTVNHEYPDVDYDTHFSIDKFVLVAGSFQEFQPSAEKMRLIQMSAKHLTTCLMKIEKKMGANKTVDGLILNYEDINNTDQMNQESKDQFNHEHNKSVDSITENESNDNSSTEESSWHISRKTCSKILETDIQDCDFITRKLPVLCSFSISNIQWEQLLSSTHFTQKRSLLQFNAGTWQDFFINGIKQSNKLCSIMFKRHSLSASLKRKSKGKKPKYIFQTHGYCANEDCQLKVHLYILPHERNKVYVEYENDICHSIFNKNSRPIRKVKSDIYKNEFQNGKLPYTKRSELSNEKSPLEKIAGNCDDIGTKSNTLNKIASESRQVGRLHENVFQSLLLTTKMEHENGKCFIQEICMKNLRVLYWTENTVALWHNLKNESVCFIDATGSVVRKMPNSKRILYYELSLNNPVKGGPSLPVASMLTEDHAVPNIKYFLEKFNHAEKVIYGYRTVSKPSVINCDFSMAMIISIIESFNKISFDSFLNWCFKIVSGEATPEDLKCSFTIVHICLAHFMNLIKLKLKKLYKRGMELVMHIFGLLSQSETLAEAEDIFYHLLIVLKSKVQSPTFKSSYKTLNDKIYKKPQRYIFQSDIDNSQECFTDEQFPAEDILSRGNVTEEEFYIQCNQSPFRVWAETISQKVDIITRNEENSSSSVNNYWSKTLPSKLLKLYSSSFPLWSMVMSGDLCRHGKNYNKNIFYAPELPNPARTSGAQEQRFYVLKQLTLSGRNTHRIDEFSSVLFKSYSTIEKEFTLYYVKNKSKVSKLNKKSIEESWNKSQGSNLNLQNSKVGMYQKPPEKNLNNLNEIQESNSNESVHSIIHSVNKNFCPIANKGLNCWLSASLQATARTKVVQNIMENYIISVEEEYDTGTQLFSKIYQHLLLNGPMKLPDNEIQMLFSEKTETLRGKVKVVHRKIPSTTLRFGVQQDAHEFVASVLAKFMPNNLKLRTCFNCTECGMSKTDHLECSSPLLNLDLQKINQKSDMVQLSDLIQATLGEEERMVTCESSLCKENVKRKKSLKSFISVTKIDNFPETLFFLVKRWQTVDHHDERMVRIPSQLVLSKYTNKDIGNYYQLKGIVCHYGSTPGQGHYNSYVISKIGNTSYMTMIDDMRVKTTPFNDNWLSESIMRSAYIIVYDQVEDNVSSLPFFIPLLQSCATSEVFKEHFSANLALKYFQDVKRYSIVDGVCKDNMIDIPNILQDTCSIDVFEDFLELFMQYVYGRFQLSKTLDLCVQQCIAANCDNKIHRTVQICSPIMCIKVKDFTILSFRRSFISSSLELALCQCENVTPDYFITHLPKMLTVEVTSKSNVFSTNTFHLNLTNLLQAYIALSCKVHVLALIIEDSVNCMGLIAKNKKWFKKDTVSGVENELSRGFMESYSFPENCKVYLVCKVQPRVEELTLYSEFIFSNEVYKYDQNMKFCKEQVNTDVVKDFKMHLNRHNINTADTLFDESDINIMLSKDRWYTNRIIDFYMFKLKAMFSKTSAIRLYCVPCNWFCNTLISNSINMDCNVFFDINKIPSFTKIHKGKILYLYDYVVFPVCIAQSHFACYVVDFNNMVVLSCDPNGSKHPELEKQLQRLLYFECYCHTRKKLDMNEWSFLNFADFGNYPIQTNGYDCGPYVCMIVKAILLNRKIHLKERSVNFRHTCMHEIVYDELVC